MFHELTFTTMIARSRIPRRARRLGAGAVAVVLLVACSGSKSSDQAAVWSGEAPFGRNEDGSPRNETVSPDSATVDDVRIWNKRMADCLGEAGYEIDMLGDGRLGYQLIGDFTSDQYDAYLKESDACAEKFPFPGPSSLTPKEWERLYVATVRQANCFGQHGVDVGDPPSMQTWIDSGGGAWSPMSYLPDTFEFNDKLTLMTACPSPG